MHLATFLYFTLALATAVLGFGKTLPDITTLAKIAFPIFVVLFARSFIRSQRREGSGR